MKVKEESEKAGLQFNIQKTKITASSPTTAWQIDGETMEIVRNFIFLGSKITADGDCSHEIKSCLLLGRKAMTNLYSMLKSRHYFAHKGPSSQGYSFFSSHVWMWELYYKESRVPKIWCFWTVVLEKTLESPLDCKEIQLVHPKGNQCSLEGMMLKLKLQYFGRLMWRADSFQKMLMLGKIEGRRRRGWQRMRWLDGITDLMDMSLSKLQSWWWTGRLGVHGVTESWTWLHDWTELSYPHLSANTCLISCDFPHSSMMQ